MITQIMELSSNFNKMLRTQELLRQPCTIISFAGNLFNLSLQFQLACTNLLRLELDKHELDSVRAFWLNSPIFWDTKSTLPVNAAFAALFSA
jgi:hypothetical protein